MHNVFEKEADGIYRLRVPFERIYTCVFLIEKADTRILVDCAMTEKDVDECICQALLAHGCTLADVDMLVLTHRHGDHAGGLARLLELAPHIKVIREIRPLTGGVFTYPMAGHTEDCIGVLDEQSHTLIAGDGLQGAGVDKYPCYTKDPDAYLATLDRIRSDDRIEDLLFSHAYEPWCADRVSGRAAVLECLTKCTEYVRR